MSSIRSHRPRRLRVPVLLLASVIVAPSVVALGSAVSVLAQTPAVLSTDPVGSLELLTDPFLQMPTPDAVNVVWFTEFEGRSHVIVAGQGVDALTPDQLAAAANGTLTDPALAKFSATTSKMSKTAEDSSSKLPDDETPDPADGVVARDVWRHEGTVSGLEAGSEVPYRVVSVDGDDVGGSGTFTLQPSPQVGVGQKILLTSDHQAMRNTPANIQYAAEAIGGIDAVFFAGDLVNIPDRASEWFDSTGGSGFFPVLQGAGLRAGTDGVQYVGAQVIQNAPIFPAIGNHEVQGPRNGSETSLGGSYNASIPRNIAQAAYDVVAADVNPTGDPATEEQWIIDNSFSTTTYEEIFTLPEDSPGGEKYYAVTFGDVRLVSLFSTRIWRGTRADADPAARTSTSRYQEAAANLDDPLAQGYGEHIFEAIDAESDQYAWLRDELDSDEFANARYRVVMLHEGPQGLGDNVMPQFADPSRIEETDADGNVIGVRYEYRGEDNRLLLDLQPMLEAAGADLVQNGHSHLWNRFVSDNSVTNWIETSNTGNSYGAYHPLSGRSRPVPPAPWNPDDYWAQDNPGGLAPVVPTVAPMTTADGVPQPFIQSNDQIAFTVLDTGTGDVTSYVKDMRTDEEPYVFDVFSIGRPAGDGDGIDVTVTVDDDGRPGDFIWSVSATSPIDLGTARSAGDHLAATGQLHAVTVTDTRDDAPAWSVTAQTSDFESNTSTLPAKHLGWAPELLNPGGGANPGSAVPSGRLGGYGLARPAVLGSADEGHELGSADLGAELRLELPVEAEAGRYTATITLTAIG